MKIIEVRPCKKFAGAWLAFEAAGVEPAFSTNDPKSDAINYARGRFGGASGEIYIYDDFGESIVEKIAINDRVKYPHAD